jgi:hypothetical protein
MAKVYAVTSSSYAVYGRKKPETLMHPVPTTHRILGDDGVQRILYGCSVARGHRSCLYSYTLVVHHLVNVGTTLTDSMRYATMETTVASMGRPEAKNGRKT